MGWIMNSDSSFAQAGDIALLVSEQKKRYMVRLRPGDQMQTHRGVILHEAIIGLPWGSQVYSHLGSGYFLLQPSLSDILMEIKRNTQIMYPKDIGFLLLMMDITPGKTVIEAGSGSGALTTVLAYMVGLNGKVISYDVRPELQSLAKKNIEKIGLSERVEFKIRDIQQGFDETGVDALFLDVANSYDYIPQARAALKSGGFFGSILPTTNQVSKLLVALFRENFAFTEVCEIIMRYYKTAPERLRPTDRMVAHTGFLIFSRPIIAAERPVIESETAPQEEQAEEAIE